jgi:hypothetical protein
MCLDAYLQSAKAASVLSREAFLGSELKVGRTEVCHALRGLLTAGGPIYPTFSYNSAVLTLETTQGKVALSALGQWGDAVRPRRVGEIRKAVARLSKLPGSVETISIRREGTALFVGGYAIACTTRT